MELVFLWCVFFCVQTEEEPDVVLVKVEEGSRQTSLSIQEGEWVVATTAICGAAS